MRKKSPYPLFIYRLSKANHHLLTRSSRSLESVLLSFDASALALPLKGHEGPFPHEEVIACKHWRSLATFKRFEEEARRLKVPVASLVNHVVHASLGHLS